MARHEPSMPIYQLAPGEEARVEQATASKPSAPSVRPARWYKGKPDLYVREIGIGE